jgi:hypothetical protein
MIKRFNIPVEPVQPSLIVPTMHQLATIWQAPFSESGASTTNKYQRNGTMSYIDILGWIPYKANIHALVWNLVELSRSLSFFPFAYYKSISSNRHEKEVV